MRIRDLGLQPRFDGFVLVVEVGQISHKILHNEHVRQRVDFDGISSLVNVAQASKSVGTVDVHGTAATDTFTARTTESQSWVLLILHLDESIKNHGTTLVQIN